MWIEMTVNGKPQEMDVPPLRRLLDILREDLNLTGSKEGCGEGECGACAVIMDGRLVNSCMVPALQLHGSSVLTIEGLGTPDEVDPLQRAFVEEGAVQCGFCTPGMVMAARFLLGDIPHPGRGEIRRGLAGNLCRCTGYEKIFKAVERAADEGYGKIARSDRANVVRYRPVNSVRLSEEEGRRVFLPSNIDEALAVLAEHGEKVYMIGGATDLYPDLMKGMAEPEILMDIFHLEELSGITLVDDCIEIGSMTVAEDIARSSLIGKHLPALADAADNCAAIAVKNRATIGGNLMTASPAADFPPVLMALNARLLLVGSSGMREVMAESFSSGYRRTVRRADELLLSVRIPLLPEGARQAFFKRGSRRALTLARISLACCAVLQNGFMKDVRIAAGSMAPVPEMLDGVMAYLEGRRLDGDIVEVARSLAEKSVSPRTSAEYRKKVTGNLVALFLGRMLKEE